MHLTLCAAVGVPGVLLFAAGIPLLSAWWLWRNRRRLWEDSFLSLYGSLYQVGARACLCVFTAEGVAVAVQRCPLQWLGLGGGGLLLGVYVDCHCWYGSLVGRTHRHEVARLRGAARVLTHAPVRLLACRSMRTGSTSGRVW